MIFVMIRPRLLTMRREKLLLLFRGPKKVQFKKFNSTPMLPSTKVTTKGFTLVELLITIGILSILSMLSVRLLWDTLSIRSKQYAIEYSSDDFRLAISGMTNAIQSATTI